MSNQNQFDSWAIVELMGHVKMAGKLTEEERFGVKMGRIDIPKGPDTFVTQYFAGGSVYRITPCTEETARAAAGLGVPAPVHRWELPAPVQSTEQNDDEDEPVEFDDSHLPF